MRCGIKPSVNTHFQGHNNLYVAAIGEKGKGTVTNSGKGTVFNGKPLSWLLKMYTAVSLFQLVKQHASPLYMRLSTADCNWVPIH